MARVRCCAEREPLRRAASDARPSGLSGAEDRVWPATYMAEQIVARLYLADFPHAVRHLAFPRAGHGIAAPPGEPTTGVAGRLGGTAAGNSAARAQGWRAAVSHLASSLAAG